MQPPKSFSNDEEELPLSPLTTDDPSRSLSRPPAGSTCSLSGKKRKRRWGSRLPHDSAITLPLQEQQHQHLQQVRQLLHMHPNSSSGRAEVEEEDRSVKRYKNFRRGRSSSTCRFNQPIFDRKHQKEWRCIVCYLWNSNDLKHCNRCKAQEGVDEVGNRKRKSEFAASAQEGRRILPKTLEWPPVFESNGSDYIFDHRSNMFYESRSDFFYDPKSKLYYGNKKKAYFMYTEAKYPPFYQVSESPEQTHNQATTPKASNKNEENDPKRNAFGEAKKEIVINIKSTSVARSVNSRSVGGGQRSRSTRAKDHHLNPKEKEQLQAIEKWNRQTKEKRQQDEPPEHSSVHSLHSMLSAGDLKHLVRNTSQQDGQSSSSPQQESHAAAAAVKPSTGDNIKQQEKKEMASPKKPVACTTSGKPICTLCMRKFASFDKLKQHEALSELHKANLTKLGKDNEARKSSAERAVKPVSDKPERQDIQYKDRAQQRRQLYGDLPMKLPPQARKPVAGGQPPVIRTEAIDPAAVMGAANVGFQLFQRMLDSQPVGNTDETAASNTDQAFVPVAKGSSDAIGELRQQWEQIENLADRKATGRRGEERSGLGFSSSSPWESGN